MDKLIKKKVVDALTRRIPRLACPMCGKGPFTLIDGLVTSPISDNADGLRLGTNKQLVSAILVCNECGYTSFHNLLALDIDI